MIRNTKYNYVRVPRSDDDGSRTYVVGKNKLPSVTTILSRTKDQRSLQNWRQRIGNEQADAIMNLSSKRGTAMHKFIEAHILEKGYEDLTSLGQQAKTMANKIIENCLLPVKEYFGSEVTLYYPGLYAGTTDLICDHNGMETVADFKQSNTPDLYLQEFTFQGAELRKAKHEFLARLNKYYNIIQEEKHGESADVELDQGR